MARTVQKYSATKADSTEAPPLSDLAAGWGQRLRLARLAVAPSAKTLADRLNVSPQRWSHWEIERHPPSFAAMLMLKHWHGVSLDWIYAGDPSGLRGSLIQRMLAVPASPKVDRAQALLRSTLLAGMPSEQRQTLHEVSEPLKRR